jgi:hypothetical protein
VVVATPGCDESSRAFFDAFLADDALSCSSADSDADPDTGSTRLVVRRPLCPPLFPRRPRRPRRACRHRRRRSCRRRRRRRRRDRRRRRAGAAAAATVVVATTATVPAAVVETE